MRKYCAILFFVFFAAACRQPKELVYQGVQNIGFKQAGMQKATLAMDVRLYNPNSYTLKLKKSEIAVFLNGNPLGAITISGGTYISKLDTSSIPVTLDVDVKKAIPNLLQAAMDNAVDLKVSGQIRAGRHGIFIKVPIEYEGKQDILGGLIKL
jgi:LEA14-like dessication related protein